jgi:hypothetical protein
MRKHGQEVVTIVQTKTWFDWMLSSLFFAEQRSTDERRRPSECYPENDRPQLGWNGSFVGFRCRLSSSQLFETAVIGSGEAIAVLLALALLASSHPKPMDGLSMQAQQRLRLTERKAVNASMWIASEVLI